METKYRPWIRKLVHIKRFQTLITEKNWMDNSASRQYHYSHFTDSDDEAWRHQVTCQGSHSSLTATALTSSCLLAPLAFPFIALVTISKVIFFGSNKHSVTL